MDRTAEPLPRCWLGSDIDDTSLHVQDDGRGAISRRLRDLHVRHQILHTRLHVVVRLTIEQGHDTLVVGDVEVRGDRLARVVIKPEDIRHNGRDVRGV